MNEAHRFTEKDITTPSGFTITDLDWTVISWDLIHNLPDGRMPRFAQIILAPGLVMVRSGMLTGETYGVWDEQREHGRFTRLGNAEAMRELAITKTQLFLDRGYSWSQKPFVVDFTDTAMRKSMTEKTDKMFPVGVETLGDVLAKAEDASITMFFIYVGQVRQKHQERNRTR